jgi:hypothetical protein
MMFESMIVKGLSEIGIDRQKKFRANRSPAIERAPQMETNLPRPHPLYTHSGVTHRTSAIAVAISVVAAGAVAVVAISGGVRRGSLPAPHLILEPASIVADGYDTATLIIGSPYTSAPAITVLGPPHAATIEDLTGNPGKWQARIRAGVQPGPIRLRVAFPNAPPAEAQLESLPFTRDTAQDGTPDFLRLDDERDRQAFRRWFTWLAEAQYFQPPADRPSGIAAEIAAEIKDCAALIRYAYREALHAHDTAWAAAAHAPPAPSFDSVAKYQYPFTPLGAALFRVREGAFQPADLTAGAFAQFADVRTLHRLNTHLVSRVLSSAVPGDLLFFRQQSGAEPYHSMIYLGESQIRNDGRRYVLYHTGPSGSDPGEIRRLTVEELMRFPQPEWRPIAANPSFLGVSRWNILRKENDIRPAWNAR